VIDIPVAHNNRPSVFVIFFHGCALLLFAKLFSAEKMRRNEGGSPETPRPSKYASTGVHPDVKTHTAEFAMALRDRGVAMSTIMDTLKNTSYAPGRVPPWNAAWNIAR
jgi:hypothetical protein